MEKLDTTQTLVLEQSFLQGITLLSEIAELELERRNQDTGGERRPWVLELHFQKV
jgi:hypothetical protein